MQPATFMKSGIACVALSAACASPARADAYFDPLNFATLGALNLTSGSYTISTDGAAPVLTDSGGGVLFSGTTATQASSYNPTVGVLSFTSISIGAGATLKIVGDKPLALLSRGDITLAGVIDAGGGNGSDGVFRGPGGAGGSAGAGSVAGGKGGDYQGPGLPGSGPGAGPSTGFYGACQCTIGVGGGYGGKGGQPVTTDVGPTYGNLATSLQAGSSGSGTGSAFGGGGGGGGGGGAVELGAVGKLDVLATGVLRADGGAGGSSGDVFGYFGGGGSGGGLRLHAQQITLENLVNPHALISAQGGGFNGGGGRISFLDADGLVNGTSDGYSLIEASVAGGLYSERGVITIGVLGPVPEPATWALFGIGMAMFAASRGLARPARIERRQG